MKKIFIAMLLLGMGSHIYAQNSVKGTVKSTENAEIIPFASVYFPELDKGSETDENGYFEIKNLPKGSFKIVVSSIGFSTYSMITDTSKEENLNISLTPSAIEIEEVIVSTPFHKLQSENVMKVERASIEALKTKGAVTLAEGISNIAGVESVSTGTGIGKPVIRGLSSNRVLVYTQGVRLENQQFGAEHGLGVNDAGIESVEVIKGPASLLYGSDALGGVLYLNPEKFATSNQTEGDVNLNYFTNTEGFSTNAGVKTSGEKLRFLARGAYATHTDYETGDGISVTNSRFREYDFKTGAAFHNKNFKTEMRYNYNKSELGIPEEIGIQNNDRDPLMPYQELNTHILSSKTNVFFKNSSNLDLTLGYIFNDRKEFEEHEEEPIPGEEEEGPALHMKLKTLNYNLQYHLAKAGRLETIVGVQGMHQTNENFGEEVLIPDATTNDFGVLATSHYHFDKADLQFGVRYDTRSIDSKSHGVEGEDFYIAELNKNFNSFNIAAGIKTDFFKGFTTRLNIASGFRAPNLAELTSNGTHEGANRFEVGSPDLNNERNLQTDLSLEYKNEHFELYVNGFYNKVNDFIYLAPNGEFVGEDPVYLYAQDDAKLYGGEIGFHLHPHPLDWLHLESSFATVTGKQDNGDYLPLIPANSLTNTFRVEFNQQKRQLNNAYAFVTLQNVFEQNNVSPFETTTGGYSLFNAGLGAEVKILKLPCQFRISANNIFDKVYVAHLSRLKPDGIANIGRNINFGLSVGL